MSTNNVLVVEDDPFLRVVGLLLDPTTSAERYAAFADFFAHDEPDFAGYVARVREHVGALFPAAVRMVVDTGGIARGVAREPRAHRRGRSRSDRRSSRPATSLKVVQKFGALPRNIDQAACAAKGVRVLTIRRRANYACAEMAFALMLTLAQEAQSHARPHQRG